MLSSNPTNGGTTTGGGSFVDGTSVTIGATPNADFTFVNWTEGTTIISTRPNYTFTLIKNTTLVANFTPVVLGNFTVVLSSNPTDGGTTTGGGSFVDGTSVTIGATPNAGYTFVNWTEGTTIISTNSTHIFTLIKNRVLIANFLINTYTLNVTAVNGTVVKNPEQSVYNHGTSVILTPTPASGYVFTSWSVDATGSNNPLTVIMDKNKNITANFTLIPITYTLNVTAVNGSVTKNPDKTSYNLDESVILTPTPASGYEFTSWSVDATGSNNPLTVIMDRDKNVTANFTLIPTFTLNVTAVNGSVTKNPDKTNYNLNEVVTVS